MRMVRGGDDHDIQLEGHVVRIDRPGAPSQVAHLESAEAAHAAHAAAIAERRAQGFVEAIDPGLDDDARLVHADELQQRGDPTGELIAAQAEAARLRRKSDPRAHQRIAARITHLLDTHHDAWFGELARHTRKPTRKGPATPALDVHWRLGFAEVVTLRATDLALDEVYARLRRLPLSRYIRKLTLGAVGAWQHMSYAPTFRAMLAHGIPSRLRELEVGDDDIHRRPQLDLEGLSYVASIIPTLDTLRISGGHGPLDITSPSLRRFIMLDVTHHDLARLDDVELPALVDLELWCRDRLGIPAWLRRLPALRHLTLAGFESDGLFASLAPLAPQLQTLALPACGLDDRTIGPLAAAPTPFAQLRRLDLRRAAISPALEVSLRRKIPGARFD